MSPSGLIHQLNQFHESLAECRQLYLRGAKTLTELPNAASLGTPADIVHGMDELHRGLLMKLFISICGVDHIWTETEEKFAGILFHHLWQQSLTKRQIQDTLRQFEKQVESLQWRNLVEPFRQHHVLHSSTAELETCVMRIGNLLAKSDGMPSSLELDKLKKIQAEIISHLMSESRAKPVEAESSSAIQIKPAETNIPAPAKPPPAVDKPDEPQPDLTTLLTELDGLVGLDSVKQEIQSLVNYLKVQRLRAEAGLPETKISLHMVFCGNPGTGKTTVARILGRLYGAIGVLKKGHLVETDRAGLVAQYAGQTAIKTNALVDSALDGILFIDEAYSLITDEANDPYGHEAIQILLKRMEDNRDRLVVVLAGYPGPMTKLLHSNPGLSSRFSRRIDFPDYSPRELGEIFGRMCDANHYVVREMVQAKLMAGFDWLYRNRDERFGNGRLVRNVFERAIRRLSNRIVVVPKLSRELLTKFEFDDIELEGVPDTGLGEDQLSKHKFSVLCKKCNVTSRVRATYLGRNVRCKSCQTQFAVNWCPIVTE